MLFRNRCEIGMREEEIKQSGFILTLEWWERFQSSHKVKERLTEERKLKAK